MVLERPGERFSKWSVKRILQIVLVLSLITCKKELERELTAFKLALVFSLA